MNSPLVSIIVCSYNYGRFLGEALKSVLDQTHSEWECVIIDDGSTDNTKVVASDYCSRDKRFRYYYQDNEGVSSSKNLGLKHCKGDYIQFLDADDLIGVDKIRWQLDLFDGNDIDIVYGKCFYFFNNDLSNLYLDRAGANEEWMPKISGNCKEIAVRLLKSNIMVMSSPLLKRDLVNRVGLFDIALKGNEDWDYFIRCALVGAKFLYDDSDNSVSLIRVSHFSEQSKPGMMDKYAFFMRCKYYKVSRRLNKDNIAFIHDALKNYFKATLRLLCCFRFQDAMHVLLIISHGTIIIIKSFMVKFYK